jgi:hypothetical protein
VLVSVVRLLRGYSQFACNTYRGSASFAAALDAFTKIVRNIRVIRLIVDGEHCVAWMLKCERRLKMAKADYEVSYGQASQKRQ